MNKAQNNQHPPQKVIQIMPAECWFAVYSGKRMRGGKEINSTFFVPLLAWGLLEDGSLIGYDGHCLSAAGLHVQDDTFIRYECRPDAWACTDGSCYNELIQDGREFRFKQLAAAREKSQTKEN